MPRLAPGEVYQRIKPVDLAPVLPSLPTLPFFAANQGGAKYPCDVVLRSQFPVALAVLLAELGLGGKTARAILRRLRPGQDIPVHTDAWMPAEADWRRFQVPLVTDPRIIMRWPDDDVAVHLEAGWLYEVRYDRPHEVVNEATEIARVHLQIDQVGATI